MADPRVFLDLEFGFTHGDPLFVCVEEGRDTVNPIDGGLVIVRQLDTLTSEETTVERSKVNWTRTTRRIIEPDDVTPEPV